MCPIILLSYVNLSRAILTVISVVLHICICDARLRGRPGRESGLALPVKALHVGQEDYWLDQIAKTAKSTSQAKGSHRAGLSATWPTPAAFPVR